MRSNEASPLAASARRSRAGRVLGCSSSAREHRGQRGAPAARRAPRQRSRSASSRSSRSTSTTPWSTPPRRGTSDHPDVEVDLRPGQERHRRRRRDRRHPVDGHPGREGDRHHADQPERQGRAAEGRRRRASRSSSSTTTSPTGPASPRSSPPTTSPAASSPAPGSTDNLPAGAKLAVLKGRARHPVARRPGHRDARHARDRRDGRRRSPATDCDQTKGLDAATDLLTAHPDLDGDLRRLRAARPRCAPGHQERGHRTRQDHRRRVRRLRRRGHGHPRRRAGGLGRPVPGQDGLARDRDRLQGGQGRDRREARRHGHRDGDQGQRRSVQVTRG